VPREERVELIEASPGQAQQPAVPLEQPSTAAPADQKADVVAKDGAGDGNRDDPRQREMAEARQHRAGQQDRLARHRHACVFEKDAEEDDEVAVAGEEIGEPGRHKRVTTL
jgi:hypothetical protein